MNFLNLAAQRYSVRKFRPEPVSESDLQVILEAGRLAPTACNLQPQRIYVIRSAAGLEKLRRCTSCHFEAPLVLLICYDSSASWKRSFDGFESGCMDASIVGTHIMLAAAERGLGSTWVCYFDPALLRREFSLPSHRFRRCCCRWAIQPRMRYLIRCIFSVRTWLTRCFMIKAEAA